MPSFKAAIIQLNSQPNLDQNMHQIRHFVEEAVEDGAQLISLPENFAFYGNDREQVRQALEISERVEKDVKDWAEEFKIYILGGGYPVPAGDKKVYNRSILVSPTGEIVTSYNKIHLFDVTLSKTESYKESKIMKAGESSVVVYDIPGLAKTGFSICYDVRFPELYREMADQSVELITVPSAFTKPTGAAHWEVLLRTRAIENSAYLIAPAQTGTHGENRESYGHSMIIDPWGKVLADGGIMPGVITAKIDIDYLEEVREKLPSLKHRVM